MRTLLAIPPSTAGPLLFWTLVAFSRAALAENPAYYDSPRGTDLFGIKAEGQKVYVDEDGVNVIQANVATTVRIFGINLSNRTSITFTPHVSTRNSLCNDFSRTEPYILNYIDGDVATVTVDLPELKSGAYFICLKPDGKVTSDWYHQGTAPWVQLRADGRMMPLAVHLLLLLSLLTLSGLFSGLNLGLMALDKNELKVIASCGTEDEKRHAKAIQPARSRGNYLLCSLLLGNVLVNSSLTILLDEISSGLIAIAMSTLSIVIFGEIIPQAICSRHGLAVGAKTIWVTYFFMMVTFPLSYPISKILDHLLGDEIGNVYDRERLMEYIRITKDYNKLEVEEVNIISGALGLKMKHVGEIMTRLEDVFMLPVNALLDFQTVSEIQRRGFSRIPVYEGDRKNILALFHARDLAFVDPEDSMPLKAVIEFYRHPLIHTYEDTTLDIVLEDFKQGRSHMAFVRQIYDSGEGDPYYEVTGVVTLEDVIEEILQSEIVDETDVLTDNRRKVRRKETQVRQDYSDFAKIGGGTHGSHVISPQMALATFQYLSTTIEPFTRLHISDSVLRRLMAQKIYYQCLVEDEPEGVGKYSSLGRTNNRILYTAGKPADYFIMILEGRVRVVVGKEGLVFESGPFSFFGTASLKLPPAGEIPAQGVMSKASSRHSVSSQNLSSEPQKEVKPPSPEGIKHSPSGFIRVPTDVITTPPASAPASGAFVPDYTVKVVETTDYMKIPRKVYLAAYRATQMEKQQANKEYRSPGEREEAEATFRSELDTVFSSTLVGSGSILGMSTGHLHRESTSSILSDKQLKAVDLLGAQRTRKRSSETPNHTFLNQQNLHQHNQNPNHRQLLSQLNHVRGQERDRSLEVDLEAGSLERERPSSSSPPISPSPSLDMELPLSSRLKRLSRDNLPSPSSLSAPGSPSESSHLI